MRPLDRRLRRLEAAVLAPHALPSIILRTEAETGRIVTRRERQTDGRLRPVAVRDE